MAPFHFLECYKAARDSLIFQRISQDSPAEVAFSKNFFPLKQLFVISLTTFPKAPELFLQVWDNSKELDFDETHNIHCILVS